MLSPKFLYSFQKPLWWAITYWFPFPLAQNFGGKNWKTQEAQKVFRCTFSPFLSSFFFLFGAVSISPSPLLKSKRQKNLASFLPCGFFWASQTFWSLESQDSCLPPLFIKLAVVWGGEGRLPVRWVGMLNNTGATAVSALVSGPACLPQSVPACYLPSSICHGIHKVLKITNIWTHYSKHTSITFWLQAWLLRSPENNGTRIKFSPQKRR